MEDKVRINALLDWYMPLLTERQQKISGYYFREDLSYQEIAELEGISRTAVYDTVSHCREQVNHYEEVLHCMERSRERKKLYQQILDCTDNREIKDLVARCKDTEE